ncbi:hypothetical protein NX02_17135 [Sphingomonas sanxanigenens DSM 19645 = NX02]|uniref:Uncharacterized protein n=1 Tax=Sphingomonas sanxanigenens DSM 19645 = NX02 TaxID=1123269 RepID=W0AHI7_9SPHN|nr:hypothetical protein NX02_17135 [Sphingomonas sanxanigenens DSM 19645 = NX02]
MAVSVVVGVTHGVVLLRLVMAVGLAVGMLDRANVVEMVRNVG